MDTPTAPNRRHANDWLTVLGMAAVFLFHCARYFNAEDWHVKNAVLSPLLSLFVQFVGQWAMPLFFLLSGMSASFSLRRRGAGEFLRNRAQRLLLPFAFSTLAASIPFQVWVERSSHGQFDGSFLDFYPHYFDGLYAFGGNFAWMGLHLWYLAMLFLFSLLVLPLAPLLRRTAPGAGPPLLARGWAPLLWALPLCGVELLVNLWPEGVGIRAFGGWSPAAYLAVFLTGCALAGNQGLVQALVRTRRPALVLALAATAWLLLAQSGQGYAALAAARACACWYWLAALLGLASRHLGFATPWLGRARDAVLPFYVLHQTVIVGLGYAMQDWDLNVAAKFTLLAGLSLAGIGILHAGVARVRALRPLFGMRAAP
ncbi:MAG: acyltransferase [Thermodesulfobacteriota bacterium]